MSQQSQSKISNENESKKIENIPLSLHNINNLLNISAANSTPENNNAYNNLNYNFLEKTSSSNNKNNKFENNDNYKPQSNYSNIFKNADLSIDSFILLIYKELFSSNKFYNNDNYFKNCQKKLANLLNNERNNPNIFGDILKIFNESIKRIVEVKLKDINSQLNQYKSKLLLLEQNDRYFYIGTRKLAYGADFYPIDSYSWQETVFADASMSRISHGIRFFKDSDSDPAWGVTDFNPEKAVQIKGRYPDQVIELKTDSGSTIYLWIYNDLNNTAELKLEDVNVMNE